MKDESPKTRKTSPVDPPPAVPGRSATPGPASVAKPHSPAAAKAPVPAGKGTPTVEKKAAAPGHSAPTPALSGKPGASAGARKSPAAVPEAPATAGKKLTPTRAVSRGKASSRAKAVTPEERYHMIAEAAYYIAERRGFQGGDLEADWLEAEREIDRKLGITPG